MTQKEIAETNRLNSVRQEKEDRYAVIARTSLGSLIIGFRRTEEEAERLKASWENNLHGSADIHAIA